MTATVITVDNARSPCWASDDHIFLSIGLFNLSCDLDDLQVVINLDHAPSQIQTQLKFQNNVVQKVAPKNYGKIF